MGIINLNSDSFYAPSRAATVDAFRRRADGLLGRGVDILDLGACSSRPGSEEVDVETEWARLEPVLEIVARDYADVSISIDTYRASIVTMAYQTVGRFIVNDISSGEWDEAMLPVAGRLGLRYVAMHHQGDFRTMHQACAYDDVVESVKQYFRAFALRAKEAGVADWILDPGFGFGKTLEQNYEVMNRLEELLVMELPLLVGVSRKSMIWRLLDTTPAEALNATTALNTIALMKGASILRVHDVKEAVECVKIVQQTNSK